MRRIGLFGGTFDPPHVGHLVLAEWARVRLRLDRVVFVPAGTPPHKRGRRLTDAARRLTLTRLAVRGHPAFGSPASRPDAPASRSPWTRCGTSARASRTRASTC